MVVAKRAGSWPRCEMDINIAKDLSCAFVGEKQLKSCGKNHVRLHVGLQAFEKDFRKNQNKNVWLL